MTASSLPATLRAGADGICTLEAAAGLIIAHGTWLARDDDFGRFICHGPGTAAIGWETATDALQAGSLPCSAGERRMLHLAAKPRRPGGRQPRRGRHRHRRPQRRPAGHRNSSRRRTTPLPALTSNRNWATRRDGRIREVTSTVPLDGTPGHGEQNDSDAAA